MRKQLNIVFLGAMTMTLMGVVAFAQVPDPLPRADGKAADETKPVKVYVMLGQSNMLGFGRVGPKEVKGSLEYLVKERASIPT